MASVTKDTRQPDEVSVGTLWVDGGFGQLGLLVKGRRGYLTLRRLTDTGTRAYASYASVLLPGRNASYKNISTGISLR